MTIVDGDSQILAHGQPFSLPAPALLLTLLLLLLLSLMPLLLPSLTTTGVPTTAPLLPHRPMMMPGWVQLWSQELAAAACLLQG